MSGGGMKTTGQQSGTSTSLSRSVPYPGAKSLWDMGLKQAEGLYDQRRLAPTSFNRTQQEGLGGIIKSSRSGVPLINDAIGTYRDMATGAGDVGTDRQSSLFDYINPIARGDMIGGVDPNFEHIVDSTTERASTAAKMMAGSRGRYGSDYAADSVARAVGDTEAQLRFQNAEAQRNRQLEAAGLGLNTANSISSIGAGNQDRRMAGAAGIPGLIDARTGLSDMILQAGDRREQQSFGGAQNLYSLFDLLQNTNPFGIQTQSGTQQGTMKEPRNIGGKLLGGGLSLASLFL